MYDVIHSIMFNLENWSFVVLKKIVCAIKNGLFKISVVLFTKSYVYIINIVKLFVHINILCIQIIKRKLCIKRKRYLYYNKMTRIIHFFLYSLSEQDTCIV